MKSCERFFVLIIMLVLSGCKGEEPTPGPAAVDPPATSPSDSKPAPPAKKSNEPHRLPLESDPVLQLTADEIRDGWIQLFDSQTLAGWQANNDINWHVTEDGVIEASEGDPGLLLTTVPFSDYELRCDYWIEKDGNSGVFLRCAADFATTPPGPSAVTTDCYELNICDSHKDFKTGSLVARAQPAKEVTGEEVWKTFHVRCEDRRIRVSVDGEEILDHTDESDGLRLVGLIGLQKNAGRIRFRNIHLRPLGTSPLFNGTDLTGWETVPGSKSDFSVSDGAIVVKNGPGFLETKGGGADFVLQFETKINGDGLNSGVFFRLIPGTEDAPSNGYELQLENVFADGDRTQPKDKAGTGAIFRRTTARWVVPNDHEWFTTTLVASGARFATWVNGFQVTDWEDTRAVDPNPRRGLKTGGGPISLQGHDETTNVAFRNLRIQKLHD